MGTAGKSAKKKYSVSFLWQKQVAALKSEKLTVHKNKVYKDHPILEDDKYFIDQKVE